MQRTTVLIQADHMGWRGYIHDDSKTVFFWSQKAACTTLFTFLSDNISPRPETKHFFHTNSDPRTDCAQAIRTRGYRSVIIARHPVTRIISAYFNKFCIYGGAPLQQRSDLEGFAQELHDIHCEQTGVITRANTMTFEAFLEAIAALHARKPVTYSLINGHWRTQVPLDHDALGLYYDQIIHVEHLSHELGALARRLNMTLNLQAQNQTDVTRVPHSGYLGAVPACEVHTYNFGYDNFITPATLAKIQALYAPDFQILGYPPDPRAGLARTYATRALCKVRHALRRRRFRQR